MQSALTKRHTRNLDRALRHVRKVSPKTYEPAARKKLADTHRAHKKMMGSKAYRTKLRLGYRKMQAGTGSPRN